MVYSCMCVLSDIMNVLGLNYVSGSFFVLMQYLLLVVYLDNINLVAKVLNNRSEFSKCIILYTVSINLL